METHRGRVGHGVVWRIVPGWWQRGRRHHHPRCDGIGCEVLVHQAEQKLLAEFEMIPRSAETIDAVKSVERAQAEPVLLVPARQPE
jgi:hypothetical protein